jgi:hypothetical protein
MNLIVSLDDNNNEIEGSFDKLLEIFRNNDNLINLARNSAENSLDIKVMENRMITTKEAAENPLSTEEKLKIEQEYQEAMDDLVAKHGAPVGYTG